MNADMFNLITNNGIAVFAVAYLTYFQNTTMKEILKTLTSMNERISDIEAKLK